MSDTLILSYSIFAPDVTQRVLWSMDGWEKTKGLKTLQRQILLWIWLMARTRGELKEERARLRKIQDQLDEWGAMENDWGDAQLDAFPTMEYITDAMEFERGRPAIVWSTERFLGRPPSISESSTLSESLRRLERRGLLRRIHRGKSAYVTHVRLTELGNAWALSVMNAWVYHHVAEADLPPGGVPEPDS